MKRIYVIILLGLIAIQGTFNVIFMKRFNEHVKIIDAQGAYIISITNFLNSLINDGQIRPVK